MKKNKSLIWILAGIVLMGGMIYALTTTLAKDGPDPTLLVSKEVEKATEINSPIDTEAVNQAATEGPIASNTPTATILPTSKAELESTDPSSVNLASGGVQLVEIFAFW
jgi:hypothetical protein